MPAAQGSQDALASLRGAAPAYRKYLGGAKAEIPPLDEINELLTQLHTMRDDAEARLQSLLAERGRAPRMKMKPVQVKREEDEKSDEEVEWEPESQKVGRTYGRQRRAHTPKQDESSELESEPDSDAELAQSSTAPARRGGLGIKLRMHNNDARRPEPPRQTPALALEGETFTDNTTFSWEVPEDVDTAVLPQREVVQPPRPYPTHPLDVHDDFANKDWREKDISNQKDAPGRGRQVKDTAQVSATTFYNYADAYFKPVTEDDLAWLSSKNDDSYPFQFPELGTHYRQVWEKEDAELLGMLHGPEATPWRPRRDDDDKPLAKDAPSSASLSELRDTHMYSRTVSGGPLMERLASALLLPKEPVEMRGSDEGHVDPPPDTHKSMAEIEAQARQECESIGLLDANVAVQWQEHVDGPIASALRLAQARLRTQIKANEQRKARLFKIAQDRMAYQDYQACLAAVDREIEASWTKRMRQIKASMGKKRKGGPDDGGPSKPQLPDSLPAALERRKQLKAAFEPMFDKMQHARAPPRESIYQGLSS